VEVLDYLSGAFSADGLPALVFLDLRMPRVDGLEALKAIRADERVRDLPVVILTSSDEEKRRLGAYDDPATSIACRPLDRDQLATAAGKLGLGGLMPAR
jgi:two-component system response regulator